MYATCHHGHQHWGLRGAAGGLLVLAERDRPRVLLTLRSAAVHQGCTWSVPGGALDLDDVDVHAAACREIHEELGLDVRDLPTLGWHTFECGGWVYSTVLIASPDALAVPEEHGWETEDAAWLDLDDVDRLAADDQLHPGFAASWPALRDLVTSSALDRAS